VSLFGGTEGQSADNIEQRNILMGRVLGLSAAKDKKRQKEMYDADMEIEGAPLEDQTGGQDSKIF